MNKRGKGLVIATLIWQALRKLGTHDKPVLPDQAVRRDHNRLRRDQAESPTCTLLTNKRSETL